VADLLAQHRPEPILVMVELIGERPIGFVILDEDMRPHGGFEDGRQRELSHRARQRLGRRAPRGSSAACMSGLACSHRWVRTSAIAGAAGAR